MASKENEELPPGITIRKRASGDRYRVRVQFEGIPHECGEYRTLRLAKLALERYEAEAVLGTFVSPAEQRRQVKAKKAQEAAQKAAHKITVAHWAREWLDLLESGTLDPLNPRQRSEATIASYRSTLRTHILPGLGSTPLTDVTGDMITLAVQRAAEAGPGAARNTATLLSALFNAAVTRKLPGMTVSPFPKDLTVKKSPRRATENVPTPEEVAKLAKLMGDYGLAVKLAAWCQLRIGEVLGLQRRDFQNLDRPDSATLTVERQWASKASPPGYTEPKSGSARKIAIPPALVPEIRAQLETCVLTYPEAPVFPSPADKVRPISHNALGRRWNQARAKVHPGLQFHALRHAGLTAYSQVGATMAETMARGGHRDTEAAARYQHAGQARDRELAAKLSAMIEGKQE